MNEQKQSEELLREIRNMLVRERQMPTLTSRSSSTEITSEQANRMLEQSFRLIKSNSSIKDDPNLTYSKIKEASELLSDENPMIKSYIKDKITSQFFNHKHKDSHEEEYLLRMKEKLEKKRLEEKQFQQSNISQMIESTRKYVKNEKVKSVPIPEIQSIIRHEPYYNFQKEDFSKKSENNEIDESKIKRKLFYNDEEDDQRPQEVKKRRGGFPGSKLQTKSKMEEIHEIDEGEEDESKYIISTKNNKIKNVRSFLTNSPTFFMCFKAFLQKQIRLSAIQNGNLIYGDIQLHRNSRSSKLIQKQKYVYKVKAKKFDGGKIYKKERSLSSITKKFKTKGLLIHDEQIDDDIEKCKKVVNKRIGDSNKFHLKQIVLTPNVLYYADEQNEEENVKINKMKKLQMIFVPIETAKIKKEEGNLFQAKQSEVEVVTIKGKKRNFHFEKNFAEGSDLFNELNNLMCMKFHNINCLLGMKIRPNMEKFINQKHNILDFSQQYIRNYEEYPDRNYRTTGLSFLLSLFPQRQTTNQILLENSKLTPAELNNILTSAQSCFQTITRVEAAKNKLNKQNLSNIFKILKKSPAKNLLTLDLNNCGIDDDCFVSNALYLNKIIGKIKTLVLKENQITAKGLDSLTNLLVSKVCEIRQIDISGCPINDLVSLANMIKASHKLTILKADNCGLPLNDARAMKYLLQCCGSSCVNSLSIRKNEVLKSIQIMEGYWKFKKPEELLIDINSQLKNTLNSDIISGEFV